MTGSPMITDPVPTPVRPAVVPGAFHSGGENDQDYPHHHGKPRQHEL
jgi:hypothetical protein